MPITINRGLPDVDVLVRHTMRERERALHARELVRQVERRSTARPSPGDLVTTRIASAIRVVLAATGMTRHSLDGQGRMRDPRRRTAHAMTSFDGWQGDPSGAR